MAIKSPEVFISYKVAEPRSEQLRDDLTKILKAEPYNLRVVTDVLDLNLMADLEKFMVRLGSSRYIVVVLTKPFLYSENCMFELATMAKQGKPKDRLFPIVYDDAYESIKNTTLVVAVAKHWSQKHQDLKNYFEGLPKEQVANSTKLKLKTLKDIVVGTQDALNEIVNMRYLALKSGDVLSPEVIATYISKWAQGEIWGVAGKVPVRPWRKIGYAGALVAVLGMAAWGGNKLFPGNEGASGEVNDSVREQFIKDSLYKDSLANVVAALPQTYIETTFDINCKMVYVPEGTFTMGCTLEQGSDCEYDEKPSHSVALGGYYIGNTEVTQRQWRAVMGNSPSYFQDCDDCPVEQVNWDDCRNFLKKLNDETGLNYHLPTEAQWEYAARGGAGSNGTKFAGGNKPGAVGWYEDNSGKKPHAVGKKAANEIGLYDMSGNVWEWCSDLFDDGYFNVSFGNDPERSPSQEFRVLRGGSWFSPKEGCRVAYRSYGVPECRSSLAGFRLARD